MLEAYEYVPSQAAFVYAAPPGAKPLDPAALAAEEGEPLAQLMRGELIEGKQQGRRRRRAARRRLIEGREAAEDEEEDGAEGWVQREAAARERRLAELAEEDEGEEDRGLEAEEAGTKRQQKKQRQQQQGKQQGRQQKQRQQRQPAAADPEEEGSDGEAAEGKRVELPPPGSYAAALLRAFDDSASRAAHSAAWRAKRAVMQRNADVARRVLLDTAAWAAAG